MKVPSAAQGVRPILSRIKKSLFDILTPRLADARFLDLFAGSGAVGIEALSRGAASATFIDRNPVCLGVIRQNLSRLQLYERARVVRADITRDLTVAGGPYDLIFLGPPYHDEKWNALHLTNPTLSAITRANLLVPEGLIIGQHHQKEENVQHPAYVMVRRENYGDTCLSFFIPKAAVQPE
jgi:16S rRNA (guanine(966)-N(2))-methyltransferase RsmD